MRAFGIDAQTFVRGDVDGDKVADFPIVISGLLVMTATGFVL